MQTFIKNNVLRGETIHSFERVQKYLCEERIEVSDFVTKSAGWSGLVGPFGSSMPVLLSTTRRGR